MATVWDKLNTINTALSLIKVEKFQRDTDLVDEARKLLETLKPLAPCASILLIHFFDPLIAALKECSKNVLLDILQTEPLRLFGEGGAAGGGGGGETREENDTPKDTRSPEMKVKAAKDLQEVQEELKNSNNYSKLNLATKVIHFTIVMGLVFEWRKDIMKRQGIDFPILTDALQVLAWLHRMSNEEWQRLFETHLPWRWVVSDVVEIGQSK